MSDFDAVFDTMNAPDYPTTCIHCGQTDTKARMINHRCTESVDKRSGCWCPVAHSRETCPHWLEPDIDDAVCDDIDLAFAAVATVTAQADLASQSTLDLLHEIEQRVQDIHRSNSRDVRDDKLVELKELLNAAIVKELSR